MSRTVLGERCDHPFFTAEEVKDQRLEDTFPSSVSRGFRFLKFLSLSLFFLFLPFTSQFSGCPRRQPATAPNCTVIAPGLAPESV